MDSFVGAGVCRTQAWTARRKLQFDLFAKRFETWDAFNEAVNGRRDEIREGARAGDVTARDKCLKDMWRQKRLMFVLFPPEVHRGIEAIEAGLMEYMVRSVDAQTTDVGSPEAGQRAVARYQAVYDADQRLWAAQGVLSNLVHPYLQQYGWWELRPRQRYGGQASSAATYRADCTSSSRNCGVGKQAEGRMIDAR